MSRWLNGEFELVVSELLLEELDRVLAYPKLRARISSSEAAEFIELLRSGALLAQDPANVTRRSADPRDDYLLELAAQESAVVVSGDRHLLDLAKELPIQTARAYLDALESRGE